MTTPVEQTGADPNTPARFVLLLLFEIKGVRYGLPARDVIELVPDGITRPLPGAPSGVVGLLVRGGKPIPVIDVSEIITGIPAERRLSTRIAIVPHGYGQPGACIGLRLERASDAARIALSAFREIGVTAADAPCLGPIATWGDGKMVQRVELDRLLTPALKASLKGEAFVEITA